MIETFKDQTLCVAPGVAHKNYEDLLRVQTTVVQTTVVRPKQAKGLAGAACAEPTEAGRKPATRVERE